MRDDAPIKDKILYVLQTVLEKQATIFHNEHTIDDSRGYRRGIADCIETIKKIN